MQSERDGELRALTLIDHYRLDTQAVLFGLFGLLLIGFAGISGCGALMDLSMDIASACQELIRHKPSITSNELLKSAFTIGRNVIGTMTTTLMLAYSGSYLSLLMYFAGQGTPVMDIINLKYVSSEVLITLVGSFGLVSVAPFTALVASMCRGRYKSIAG